MIGGVFLFVSHTSPSPCRCAYPNMNRRQRPEFAQQRSSEKKPPLDYFVMLYRSLLLIAALGLAYAPAVQAQEPTESTVNSDPVPAEGQEKSTATRDNESNQQQPGPIDPTIALEGIETAIRDLVTQEDEVERQRQHNREDRDLSAQEGMAWWAQLMFWATAATVLLTTVALFAIIRTLHHTRRAADYTKDMLIEAIEVTKEAKAANQILRDEQRPWLQVTHEIHSDMRWEPENSLVRTYPLEQQLLHIVVRTKVKNLGRLPAFDVHLHQDLFIEPPGVSGKPALEAVIEKTLAPDYSGQVIFPGEEVSSDWNFSYGAKILAEKLGENNGGKIFFNPTIMCSVGYEVSSAVSPQKRITAVARRIGFKNDPTSLWLQAIPIAADELTIKRAPRGADQAT